MNKELERKLITKYPNLFKDINLPPFLTLICFGCECYDGWYQILDDLFAKLSIFKDLKLLQVKEKFGELRIYLNYYTDEIQKLILEAERKSRRTCEICGQKGKVCRTGGFIMVRCSKCLKQ